MDVRSSPVESISQMVRYLLIISDGKCHVQGMPNSPNCSPHSMMTLATRDVAANRRQSIPYGHTDVLHADFYGFGVSVETYRCS